MFCNAGPLINDGELRAVDDSLDGKILGFAVSIACALPNIGDIGLWADID